MRDRGYISEKTITNNSSQANHSSVGSSTLSRVLKIDPHENVRELVSALVKAKPKEPFVARAYRIVESVVLEVRAKIY
jgi:hypothetical protein